MRNEYRIEGNDVYITVTQKERPPFETVISVEDLPRLLDVNCGIIALNEKFGTYVQVSFYPRRSRQKMGLHRFLMNPPKGMYVDHINSDKLDNRRSNLRIVTNAENMQNVKKPRSDNKSGYRGVWKVKDKWQGWAKVNGKDVYAGSYDTAEEAHIAVSNCRAVYQPASPDAREIENPVLPEVRTIPKSTSEIKGITWCNRTQRWKVQLKKNNVNHYNGYYSTIAEAMVALEELKQKIGYSR